MENKEDFINNVKKNFTENVDKSNFGKLIGEEVSKVQKAVENMSETQFKEWSSSIIGSFLNNLKEEDKDKLNEMISNIMKSNKDIPSIPKGQSPLDIFFKK